MIECGFQRNYFRWIFTVLISIVVFLIVNCWFFIASFAMVVSIVSCCMPLEVHSRVGVGLRPSGLHLKKGRQDCLQWCSKIVGFETVTSKPY